MANVFVYGTLLADQLMEVVVGRRLASSPAIAPDYVRRQLAHRRYPGIAQAEGHEVAGLVYYHVDQAELARLDYYEGPEYVRQTIAVMNPEPVDAETYVVKVDHRHLLTAGDWDLEQFRKLHLQQTLNAARRAMQRYAPGQGVVDPDWLR